MKFGDYIKDKGMLYLMHFTCMIFLTIFLCATNYSTDNCILILICWFLILAAWTWYDYFNRKKYFDQIDQILQKVDKRFLLGELMPDSARLEDRIYRELIRRSNKSVIERIHSIENDKKEYREYIESWVHEIKAPITGVALTCENNRNEVTRRISLENQKIENYVDMALYYARSDEVYRDFVIVKTDLQEIAQEIAGRNKYYLIQNRMQAEIHCRDVVYTDKKWIAFILNQLVLNSTKYKKESGGCIRIFTETYGHGVRLLVEDDGIGIREEELPRVFEKGFTGTNGRTHERSTGMGLYLCQKLCGKLGIRIYAQSEEGKYTRMTLEFPIGKLHSHE